ncbi:MAG: tyrosine-type recombinase/integrase [Desulfomonilia bacterium]
MAGLLIIYNSISFVFIEMGSYRVARQDHLNTKKLSNKKWSGGDSWLIEKRLVTLGYMNGQGRTSTMRMISAMTSHTSGTERRYGKRRDGPVRAILPSLPNRSGQRRIRSIRHGLELPQDKPKTLFKDAVKKYLEWAKTNKTKEGRDDRYLYDKHLKKRFGDIRMDQISSFDLEKMKSELLKEGYAPATVKHALVLIRQIYNKAIIWNLYQGESPVKKVKMPTISNQRTRFLSIEEADTLLKALKTKSQQVHDMALLSLHTGMRFGEIAGLKVHDVDLTNGLVNISDPKNRRPRRAYMTAAVKAMFQARIPTGAKSNDLIFPDEKGKKMEFVSKTFPRVVDALGLNKGVKDPRQKVTFHSLRHTFASWLALQGEQIQTISELLGHRTPSNDHALLSPYPGPPEGGNKDGLSIL